jgi:hypothetical protein
MGRTATCKHRWVLAEPARGGIQGACRRCGASRTFPSGLEPAEGSAGFVFVEEEPEVSIPELVQELAASNGYALV